MVPWSGARTKVQIKLAIQRLRTLQEKKLAMAKKSRREIADLLLKDRVETARLRVEGLIGDDIYVELLELLELYSEKLQARFNLLDLSSGTEPEPSIADAICAIVYAAPRTELKELQVLREMLMQKYGRAFALTLQPSDPPPESVPARVSSKLALYTPARELVDAYLYEIAKGYGVNWQPEPEDDEAKPSGEVPTPVEGDGRDSDDDSEGGPGVAEKADKKEAISVPELAEAKKGDNLGEENKAKQSETPAQPVQAKKLSPEEELAQRFDRLKKL